MLSSLLCCGIMLGHATTTDHGTCVWTTYRHWTYDDGRCASAMAHHGQWSGHHCWSKVPSIQTRMVYSILWTSSCLVLNAILVRCSEYIADENPAMFWQYVTCINEEKKDSSTKKARLLMAQRCANKATKGLTRKVSAHEDIHYNECSFSSFFYYWFTYRHHRFWEQLWKREHTRQQSKSTDR